MALAGLTVLYRDAHVLVVNKPSGMLVHRGWDNAPVVAMTAARNAVGQWVYPVHRLDRGASGVLAFALDPVTASGLHPQFEDGTAVKRYVALVRGIPPEEGVIDHPVRRREDGPKVPAVTSYRRLATVDRYAVVEARPHTGRLHQIRVHLKHLGHPLLGDVNYGRGELNRLFRERYGLRRLALHAAGLTVVHPVTGTSLTVTAPLPADLADPFRAMGLPTDYG